MEKQIFFKEESYKIIGACYEVYNAMGHGFLEAVYQECLRKEFQIRNVPFIEKPRLEIFYKDYQLDQSYEPDFLCYNEIIIEIKAVKTLGDDHKAQVYNYFLPKADQPLAEKATGKRLGLLVNFGHHPKIESQRLLN